MRQTCLSYLGATRAKVAGGALALLVSWALCGCPGRAAEEATLWPTSGWATETPEAVGFDPAPFAEFDQRIRAGVYGHVDRVFVTRFGRAVVDVDYPRDYREISRGRRSAFGCGFETCEEEEIHPYNYYYPDWHPYYQGREVHSLQSVTKSVAATLIGIAIGRGEIPGVEQSLLSFFDDRDLSDVDSLLWGATLEDQLTMRTGIEWNNPEARLTLELEASDDWIAFTLGRPSDAAPGTKWVYSDGSSHLMSGIIRRATGEFADSYAERHLFGPLGIPSYAWKKTPRGYPDTEGGLYLAADQLAKIGLLYLRDGMWEDRRLLPDGWVAAATSRHVPNVRSSGPEYDPEAWGYGYQWWILERNGVEIWAGRGFGEQALLVLPEFDVVAVVNAWNVFLEPHESAEDGLLSTVLAALGRSSE